MAQVSSFDRFGRQIVRRSRRESLPPIGKQGAAIRKTETRGLTRAARDRFDTMIVSKAQLR
jgi:hypothetical protein